MVITESVKTNNAAKTIYVCKDIDLDIEIISKEQYKRQNKVTHFPFRINKNNKAQNKYRVIEKITYTGMPTKLPSGFSDNFSRGYGFTKNLNPLIYFLESNFAHISEIEIKKSGNSKITGNKIIFKYDDIEKIRKRIQAILDSHREEKNVLINNSLNEVFPAIIDSKKKEYTKNKLKLFLREHNNVEKNLSNDDLVEILSILENKRIPSLIKKLKTKDIIEESTIEDLIEEFGKLIKQKTKTKKLEEKWQSFFKKYSMIFSQILAFPTVLFDDKVYVGGKETSNLNGKIADFLYQNKLTKNAFIIEIKTHKTKLIGSKTAYRGTDVYPLSKEFSGGINQILNQKDNLQKEYSNLLLNEAKKGKGIDNFYQVFDPTCVLVIGHLNSLKKQQYSWFELFRNAQKDIIILTFDEVLEKCKFLLEIIKNSKK